MMIGIDNGARVEIPGLASSAGVRIRGNVATVSVRADQLARRLPSPGTPFDFCDAFWVLDDPAPLSRDSTSFTFQFRRQA